MLRDVIEMGVRAGIGAGVLLAVARPAIGAQSSLVQDFSCTIVGALGGEIIGLVGGYASMKKESGSDVSAMVMIGGTPGLVIGTTAGVITSIALSRFKV